MKLATVAPVTKPTEASRGRSSRSSSQLRGHVLEAAAAGVGVMVAAVLAPGAGQPVGRDADRVRGADDPAEEARAGHGREAGLRQRRQLLDHEPAVTALFRQRFEEGLAHLREALGRPLRTAAEGAAELHGALRRLPQHRLMIGLPAVQRRPGNSLGRERSFIGRSFRSGPDLSGPMGVTIGGRCQKERRGASKGDQIRSERQPDRRGM